MMLKHLETMPFLHLLWVFTCIFKNFNYIHKHKRMNTFPLKNRLL